VADNEDGKAGDEAPLEPHIFQAGMDPNAAEQKLMGLLSDENLVGNLSAFGGTEDGEADDDGDAPLDDDQDEREEDESEESEEDDAEESLEEWDEEEEDEDDDSEEDLEEEELHAVTVDGQRREITYEELVNGYSFQAHNTRTAQQLAEGRSALEDETAQVRQSRDRYSERLTQVEQALTNAAPQEPDWEALEKEDPQKFAVENAKWQRHQRQLAAVHEEQKKVRDEQVQDRQGQIETYRAQEGAKLLEVIPEWKDEEKLRDGATKVADYARTLGYTDEEIAQVYDHRAILMMRKAMLHDQSLVKGKAKIRAKKKGSGGKTLKPGVKRSRKSPSSKRMKGARRQLRESGRVKDATKFLEQYLPDDF